MIENEKLQQGKELPESESILWPDDNEVAFNIVLEKVIYRKRRPMKLENGEHRPSPTGERDGLD